MGGVKEKKGEVKRQTNKWIERDNLKKGGREAKTIQDNFLTAKNFHV